jgi:SAM-dependent methyltransferase
MTPKDYNDNFHNVHFQNSINSAKELIPLFLSYFKPKSVLDIGCGLGTWLSVFEQNQCEIFGIDGDYVNAKDLVINQDKFKACDLNVAYNLEKKFDLTISLEVAEHIFPDNARTFINSLCLHSDIVLFSAAVPGQEGTLHYNEQYNEYWIELFSKNGYQCIDFLRHKIWNNNKISWWYRQNILIFIKQTEINNSKYDLIVKEMTNHQNTYIHPNLFAYKCQKTNKLERILNNPIKILKYYLKRKKLF